MKYKIRAEISMYKDFEIEANDPFVAMDMVKEQLEGKKIRQKEFSSPKLVYNFLEGFTVS